MTRQKKELMKKINDIDRHIACDIAMGCGCAPYDFYEEAYKEQYELQEQLAVLSHYKCADDMFHDMRGAEQTNMCCDYTGLCGGPSCPQFYQCNQ